MQGVKSIGGEWVPADLNARVRRVVDDHQRCAREREQLEYMVARGQLVYAAGARTPEALRAMNAKGFRRPTSKRPCLLRF